MHCAWLSVQINLITSANNLICAVYFTVGAYGSNAGNVGTDPRNLAAFVIPIWNFDGDAVAKSHHWPLQQIPRAYKPGYSVQNFVFMTNTLNFMALLMISGTCLRPYWILKKPMDEILPTFQKYFLIPVTTLINR